MRLRSWTSAPIAPDPEPLEMLREIVAVTSPSAPVDAKARTLFGASRLRCQRGGQVHSGERCLTCARIVSFAPSPGRRTATVRCLWTDRDPVELVMTLPDRVARIDWEASLAEGARAAHLAGVHHLLVVESSDVIGTICECALGGSDGSVGEWMIPHVWTVPPTATLGQVGDAMQVLEVGHMVIADRGVLLGAIEARDLQLVLASHVH